MKRALLLMTLLATPLFAAEPVVVDLWPGKAPGETGNVGEEKYQEPKAGETAPVKRLGNVSKPTITITRPKADIDTGAAVVIAPGGGYSILAWEHEGTQVAEWLNSVGVRSISLFADATRRVARSSVNVPADIRAGGRSWTRRRTAWSRAINSATGCAG